MDKTLQIVKPEEVHIWKYKISNWRRGYLALLSEEEKDRWLRFQTEESQKRFAHAHAFLRMVLERYTGTQAAQIEIITSCNGRPQLKNNLDPPIYFNLSYRDDYAVVAVSLNNLVGVDIESVKNIGHISSFINAHFSYEEKQKVLSYKNLWDRLAMVFTIWVMKEAVVKAKSTGLSEPMKEINLCQFLDKTECVPDFDPPNIWHVARFQVADNYKAACAVRSSQATLKLFEYGVD
jgi:4'-phosphopantetheinyl transferase